MTPLVWRKKRYFSTTSMARFKRRSIHAPNLTDKLSTAEERRLNSLLRRGSRVRFINPLCEVYRRRKVEWIDHAENLCQMCVDFSYILVVFSYIDGFLDFG